VKELLAEIAHGGMERWTEYQKVEATIVSGLISMEKPCGPISPHHFCWQWAM